MDNGKDSEEAIGNDLSELSTTKQKVIERSIT